MNRKPLLLVLLTLAVATLALPSTAFGQPALTWVSGTGDDANPCSRTAPCKTFAGALPKTEVGGEIDVLESGNFGPVTITKSITISATAVTASVVLLTGTNSITISAPGSTVTLRGLELDGAGVGLSGVQVNEAASVNIEDSSISGFMLDGVDFQPTNANAKLSVANTTITHNLGDGILAAPDSEASGTVELTNDEIDDNGCGVVATSIGKQASPNFAEDCGTNESGLVVGAPQVSSIDTSVFANTGAGVLSNGSGANNTIATDVITGNGVGLQEVNGGTIQSLGFGNEIFANTTDGSPTSETGPIGPEGKEGNEGTPGQEGKEGLSGLSVLHGESAPTAETGSEGDFYFDTTTNVLYGPRVLGTWESSVSLVGPEGKEGKEGKEGASGKVGEPGKEGAAGKEGKDGKEGPQGKQGEPGRPGEPGKEGKPGVEGKEGPAAPLGTAGPATFVSEASVPSGNCLYFPGFAPGPPGNSPCPAPTAGYPSTPAGEDTLAGPTQAGGATITDLYAYTSANVMGANTVRVAVIDNTTEATLLFCIVNATTKNYCSNSIASGSAAAGDNIEVKVTAFGPSGASKKWRVTFLR